MKHSNNYYQLQREKLEKHKRKICNLYGKEKISTVGIGKLFDIDPGVIRYYLIKWGIEIRSRSEALKGHTSWSKGLTKETDERLKKTSESLKGGNNHNYNKSPSDRTRVKLSQSLKNTFRKGRIVWNKGLKGIHLSPETEFQRGYIMSDSTLVKLWRSQNKKPNRLEKKLNALLQKCLPGEYQYTGNGKFILDGLCPDFINCNGQKKIIELFGRYWHGRTNRYRYSEKGRKEIFGRYGYKLLVIWDDELHDTEKIINKIKEFNQC